MHQIVPNLNLMKAVLIIPLDDSIVLTNLYFVQVDVIHIKKPFILFQWMGMNALIVYVLAACELFPTLIQGFYWRSPENNLVNVLCCQICDIFSHLLIYTSLLHMSRHSRSDHLVL